jgi:glycosyltransferase involved in cell wall biosynthesis
MPPPSILFVDHSAALGGAELYLLDVAKHFRDRAAVVTFENGPFVDRLQAARIQTKVIAAPPAILEVRKDSSFGRLAAAVPALCRFAFQLGSTARDYDILFANSQKSFLVTAIAGVLSRRPVIWNLHDLLTDDHFSAGKRYLVARVANACASRVIVNSEATREAFVASGGRRSLTHIVYNGIDAADFDVSPHDVQTVRNNFQLQSEPVVGVFSRLASWKGQHVLLDAVAALPEIHVLIVGDALFGGDVKYARALRQTAEKRGMAHRVHFAGFQQNIAPYLHACDVVIHTSTAPEPFGRVIVEGMLAGKPVIATKAGGAREIITSEQNGLLVAPGDSAALRQAIVSLLSKPDMARALAQRGRQEAASRYSLEKMVEGINHVFQSVAPPVTTA